MDEKIGRASLDPHLKSGAKLELKRATTGVRPQHLHKVDAALCRLGIGLMIHPRVGRDAPHDFYAIADMIASRIQGCTVSM